MRNPHGAFIWYELMTSDVDAAADFYRAVVGWSAHGFDESMGGYRAFTAGETDVAGLMAVPEKAQAGGIRPAWFGYVGVDDVDAAAADIGAAGGVEHVPPTDIPGVGRFALFADPQGAMFYVMRGATDQPSPAFAPERTGHCQWNELATSDPAGALAFYTGRFGWEKGDAMPMGEMGEYRFINHHGAMIGAVMARRDGDPPPAWLFYFGTGDIDAAAGTIADRGGTLLHGPAEVPTGNFILVATDPQGAAFGLVGPRGQG